MSSPNHPKYILRFFFEYGGICLWTANDTARERFGGYPVEFADLPLPDDLRNEMSRACGQFDTSLDRNDPAGPSIWTPEQWQRFRATTDQLLARLRVALGERYEIRDERKMTADD